MGLFDDVLNEGGSSAEGGLFDDVLKAPKKQNKGIVADLATDLKRGVQNIPSAVTGLADIPVAAVTGSPLISAAAEGLGKMTGFQPGQWAKDAEQEYSEGRKKARQNIDAAWKDGTAGDIASAYLQNPSQIAGSIVESIPSMLVGGLAGRAALGIGGRAVSAGAGGVGPVLPGAIARTVGEKLAPAVGAGLGEGAVMAGQAMDSLTEQGVDPRTAAGYAAGTGIVGAALGAGGGKVAQMLGVVDPETAIAGGAARAIREGANASKWQAAKETGKNIIGGGISEGVFEELPQSVMEQGLSNLAQGKPIGEGVARAGVEGALAGFGMGAGFNAIPARQEPQGPLSRTVEAGKQSGAIQETPLALGYNANVRTDGAPLYTYPDGSTLTQAEYEQRQAAEEKQRLDGMVQDAPLTRMAERAQERASETAPDRDLAGLIAEENNRLAPIRAGLVATALERQQARQEKQAVRDQQGDGSFSTMNEFADLLNSERQQVESSRRAIAAKQALRRESDLESADARVADSMAKESEQKRRNVLESVLADPAVQNHAAKFSAELKRQGFRNFTPTESELSSIARFGDILNAKPETTIEPSLPNEATAEQLGIKERKEPSQAQGSQRDKIAEVKQLVSAGWKVNGRTLVSPTGKKRNLNFAERYAAVKAQQEKRGNAAPIEQVAQEATQANDEEARTQPAAAPEAERVSDAQNLQAPAQAEQTGVPVQGIDAQSAPVQQAADVPKPAPVRAVKKAGPQNRDDLVGAIIRVTGNKGISAGMAQTITGDKAGSGNAKLRGLFTNDGIADLDDTAELLRTEEGYDVRDGNHLAELIREQAAGNAVYSMERTEREAQENAEKEYRDNVRQRAKALGMKVVGRKFDDIEKSVLAAEMQQAQDEAPAERDAIAAAEQVTDESISDLYAGAFDNESWLNDEAISEAKDNIGYGETQSPFDGVGETSASETAGSNPQRSEEAGFGLTGQTNAEASAEYKQQQEEANKKDDEPAPNVTADQVDMWNTQGSLIDNNREPSQSQQKSDAAPESAQDNAPAITADNDSVATVESHSDFMERLNDGGITIDEFMAHFESVKNSKSGLVEELGKKTKLELLRLIGGYSADRYKNDKKDQVVSVAYRSMLDDFVLGDNISYGIGAKYEDVIGGYVSRYTQEDLRAYADKIKSRREERQAQREDVAKAIADPKTVVDFDTLLRAKKSQGMTFAEARMSLTPEQRAEYDRIKGIESRDQRKARADQQKTDIRVASQTTEGQVVETKHTKTGEPLFVVKAAERVDRDVYTQWNNTAKRIGGYYSSFRGNGAVPGFQFKTRENADAFLNFIGGNAESAKEAVQERRDAFADDRSQSAVERLNEMAERLEEKADQSLGRERKENTERRARFAASAESAANAEKAMAKTMRRIADAIDNGTAQFLDRVRQKSQIEYLTSVLRTAKDSELRSKYPSYAEQEKHKGEPATGETADYAEFPQYAMMRSDLANLARKMVTLPNMKMLGQRILKVADDTSAAYTAFAKEHLMEVSRFGKADGSGLATFSTMKDAERSIDVSNLAAVAVPLQIKRGEYRIVLSPSEAINRGIWKGDDRKIFLSPDVGEEIVEKLGKLNRRNGKHRGIDAHPEAPWQFENAYNSRKRLAGMGIEQPWEFRAALREFANLKEAPKEADKIKAQERSMIGRKNDGLDFFPTPVGTAQEMVNAAELKDGMSVLEPSAGMGHIAEQIRESGVEPDVVEFNGDRRELLELKGFNVVGFDFMDVAESYDRIIMNPPFSNRRDAEHVQHAYSLLKPGGRIVAIMGEGVFFGQDKKAQDFREWLDGVGGTSEKLADGTFLDPSLPVNTGTNARMVVINKPADALYSKGDETVSAPMQQSQAEQRIKSLLGNKVGRLLIESGVITFTNKGNAYQGATYTNGTIALNLDALSADNFDGVLLHEGFHSTIKQLVGEETYAKLMKQLENMLKMGKGAQWVADANAAVPDNTKPENVTEEIAAYAVEQVINGGKLPNVLQRWVQNFLSAIRTAIIQHMPSGKLKNWAVMNLKAQDLARLAKAGLKAKAQGQLQAQGREAMAYSKNGDKVSSMADKDTVAGTQAPTSAGDGYTGSEKEPHVAAAEQIAAVMSLDKKATYGLRIIANDYGDYERLSVGAKLSNSMRWEDGDWTDIELPGTSVAAIKSKTVDGVIEAIKLLGAHGKNGKNGYYFGDKVVLVKGVNTRKRGQDVGERILSDATAVGIWSKPDSGLSEVMPNEPTASAGSDEIHYSKASQAIKSAVGAVTGAENRIVGASNRQYDQAQRQFFKNVGRDVERKNIIGRTLDYLRSDFWKKMAVGVVDQFRGLRDLNDNGQAYLLARLSKGTAGAFDALLNHGKLSIRDGVYDADTSGGFLQRLGITLNGEIDDFLWWTAANRAENLSKQDRENLFTAQDIAAGKSLASGTTDFDYTVQTGPLKGKVTRNRAVIYADANRVFNEFQKNALDMAEQSGLIDGSTRHLWESEFYVPFYRVSDEDGEFVGAKMGNALVRQSAFKKLKGGTDKLNADLLANTLMNWSHLIEASAKNRAAKASLEAAGKMGAAQRVASTMGEYAQSNGSMLPPGTKGAVWHMDGGNKVEYLVSDPFVMTAITSLEYAGMRNAVMDVMSKFKHYLTIGVTANPAFKIRNLIRDSIQAIGTSDLGYNPITNIKEGIRTTKRDSQEYVSALASGGLIRFGTMLENSEADRVRQLIKSGVKESTILNNESKLRAFYDQYLEPAVAAYNELGNRSEEINRAALYNQLIKQGRSHAEAALLARDLMDFSLQGSFTTIRFLSQVVPFFNARLQGMYKLGRSTKDNPAKLATVIGACAVASIALMLGYDDDEEWKRREDFDRDGYFWFKFGGLEWRIPKPFEVGAVASLAERTLEYMINDEMTGERYRKVVSDLVKNNLSMNPVPQVIKPIIDLYANKDSFTGRPIETMNMQRLEPEMRFNSQTSMVARGLSNATAGALSPVQYDHIARAYFGWLGSFAVGMGDMAARAVSDEPEKPTADYFKLGSFGFAKEAGTGSSRYVSMIYDHAKELEQAYATYRQLVKDGKMGEAQEYMEDNKDKLSRYRSTEAVKKAESRLNEQIRLVEKSNLSADEKRERINAINKQKEQVAMRLAPGLN